jgi:hypothetical protein
MILKSLQFARKIIKFYGERERKTEVKAFFCRLANILAWIKFRPYSAWTVVDKGELNSVVWALNCCDEKPLTGYFYRMIEKNTKIIEDFSCFPSRSEPDQHHRWHWQARLEQHVWLSFIRRLDDLLLRFYIRFTRCCVFSPFKIISLSVHRALSNTLSDVLFISPHRKKGRKTLLLGHEAAAKEL